MASSKRSRRLTAPPHTMADNPNRRPGTRLSAYAIAARSAGTGDRGYILVVSRTVGGRGRSKRHCGGMGTPSSGRCSDGGPHSMNRRNLWLALLLAAIAGAALSVPIFIASQVAARK